MRKISDVNATLLNLVLEVPDFGNSPGPLCRKADCLNGNPQHLQALLLFTHLGSSTLPCIGFCALGMVSALHILSELSKPLPCFQ